MLEFYSNPSPLVYQLKRLCLFVLQIQLQSVFQSKHVDHFLPQAVELQNQLTVADSVLVVWMEVQRSWVYLESIFKGFDDIHQQLPADTQRFQAVDAEFQVFKYKPMI